MKYFQIYINFRQNKYIKITVTKHLDKINMHKITFKFDYPHVS